MISPQNIDIKPNCRYCKHAGPVINFICACSILKINRSTGIRKCSLFIVDIVKYNIKKKGAKNG